jgi:DNA-binding PadR family transcriptional regulator
MSASSDKRRRGDLNLFVLALIANGVTTPYELKTAAVLSPGATIPALARLLKDGFVIQSKPSPRGRADHRITTEGRHYIRGGWKELSRAE